MKNKFSKKKLKKIIASGFTDLSTDEIKSLIQKEVEKGADNTDTEYIDLCFELLSIKESQKSSKKIKFKTPAKAFIAAAVLCVVFISGITVLAVNWDIPQKIAQLVDGNAEIEYGMSSADTTADGYALADTDLAKEIAEYGIYPITFPQELTGDDCKITQIEDLTSDKTISLDVAVDFEYNSLVGYMVITQYADDYDWYGENTVTDVSSGQIIRVNGMDVLVFEQDNNCTIKYTDNLTTYDIYLECDLDSAVKFAESIK